MVDGGIPPKMDVTPRIICYTQNVLYRQFFGIYLYPPKSYYSHSLKNLIFIERPLQSSQIVLLHFLFRTKDFTRNRSIFLDFIMMCMKKHKQTSKKCVFGTNNIHILSEPAFKWVHILIRAPPSKMREPYSNHFVCPSVCPSVHTLL